MDLSLATDAYSSAYLHQHHHNHLQQQQQQQQQHHLNYQPLQQHHYQYHHPQNPQALSLAPPSGKGFFDLERTGASSSLGLGHLGAPSSYQPEYGLSSYTPGAPSSISSSAAPLPSHHLIPSQSPGQMWSRNSTNPHIPHDGAAQNMHYSSARAASAIAHDLHSTGYNSGTHALSDDRPVQLSSTHGWAVSEPHHSQWPQQLGDNCFPPGVEPSATSAANAVFSHMHPHLQGQTHSHPQYYSHPTFDLQAYQQLQQHTPLGVNLRTTKPPQKLFPKRKQAKETRTKIPVVKTTAMKGTGALAPEKGLGWCSACQRNCVTAVALRQHLEGKGHRRQVERQKLRAEGSVKTVEDDGGVSNMLEQVWVQVSSMGKPAGAAKIKKKSKAQEVGKDVKTKKKQKAEESGKDVDVKPIAEGDPTDKKKKVVEVVRCELCNVECNSQMVLEIHFGGKKHATRLKKMQEPDVASNTEQPTLINK